LDCLGAVAVILKTGIRTTKSPVPQKRNRALKSKDYLEEVTGAGAGAGAALGQQEAAKSETAAAARASLVIFIMVDQMWLLLRLGHPVRIITGKD
jgi:hypothetical protein